MSTAATKWAWQAELPPSNKLVLLALAECHNGKTGQCNPRIETIAEMVGRSKRAIQYALKELCEAGYIQPIRRRKGARQASNQYALALDGVVFQGAKNSSLKAGAKCKKLHPESARNCTLYIDEPEVEPESTQPPGVFEVVDGGNFAEKRWGTIHPFSPARRPTPPSRYHGGMPGDRASHEIPSESFVAKAMGET